MQLYLYLYANNMPTNLIKDDWENIFQFGTVWYPTCAFKVIIFLFLLKLIKMHFNLQSGIGWFDKKCVNLWMNETLLWMIR